MCMNIRPFPITEVLYIKAVHVTICRLCQAQKCERVAHVHKKLRGRYKWQQPISDASRREL